MIIYCTSDINRIFSSYLQLNGLQPDTLIERGAAAVVAEIEERWGASTPVHVFAGPYNNGAMALAVARLLYKHNFRVSVTFFNIQRDPANELCRRQREILKRSGYAEQYFQEVTTSFRKPDFDSSTLIVDGIFGSELNRSLEGGYVNIIKHLNELNLDVLSLDVPSGMSGDWNATTSPNHVVKARLTISFQFPHLAFYLPNMAVNVGEWVTVDIGVKAINFPNERRKHIVIGSSQVRQLLPHRPPFCSKHDFGNAIIFGGSFGMLGAAVLSARGALRAGVGKLTLCTPLCGFQTVQTSVPEALYQYAEAQEYFAQIRTNPRIRYDAVAIGPGIGTKEDTLNALDNFLSTMPSPVILDADALNCIALRPALLNKIPNMSILTPHEREFDNLFGSHANGDARILKAIEMARRYNINILLKGHFTTIVSHDGTLSINTSGTPALATPGSGDVLTGVITALMAQLKNPILAAIAGAYVHGLAGEFAAREHGEYGVLASDVANAVGKAIKEIQQS